MNQNEINKAAVAHAKDQLGEAQFKQNKNAVKAIKDDFKAGAQWAIQQASAC